MRCWYRLCWHVSCCTFGRKNNVVAYDIDNKRIDILNSQKSTIQDFDIEELLKKILKLNATNKKS